MFCGLARGIDCCMIWPGAPWLSALEVAACVMTMFEFLTMKLLPEPILNFKVCGAPPPIGKF